MKITSIHIKKNTTANDILAYADIQLDNCLVIHNIRLIQLKDKRVISFPSKKIKKYEVQEDGYIENYTYSDIVHPSNSEFRTYIQNELFKIYDSEIGGNNE